jgi:scyllo-inositol 2-dehydrogenase (NADP+)
VINTVVVGHGLAGRAFHAPLIRRQPDLCLRGIVARDPTVRAEAVSLWGDGVVGYADIEQALDDKDVDLLVIATPHDSHADLAIRCLEAGKHCVVDKVMALSTREADAMIAARNRFGRMLSVFHNRRWDWDFATVRHVLASGSIGEPVLIESSVCRLAPPRGWRRNADLAGSILHDWGAHLVDQALSLGLGPCRRLSAWLTSAPWQDVDTGGHGRIVMEFDRVLFQVETSRICSLERPRWWIVGSRGGFVKFGVDPQESALREGNIDRAAEPQAHMARVTTAAADGTQTERPIATVQDHWDGYYRNIAEYLLGRAPLAVTAEQAREVVRVLEAADRSVREHAPITGSWG